ncbi:MAG: SHOCT domain-containing protein [Actinomycetota bacterium]|jgi:putative membrane protein
MEVSAVMHMDGAGPWIWWMWIGGLVFWGSLIAFGVWAIRRFTDRPRRSNARRVLEERFARGEIDEEEFRRRTGFLEAGES